MCAPAAELQGHILTPQGWVRGQLQRRAVSYTHLTLPTNREV